MSDSKLIINEFDELKREIQELKARLAEESGHREAAYQFLVQRIAAIELRLTH